MHKWFDENRMYTYLKGFFMGGNKKESLKALVYARKLHKGQTRKSGEPYIIHPMMLACHAISMGITDDNTTAVLLYHDVVEDCGISINDLPCNDTVKDAVKRLTFVKPNKYLERDGEGPSINDVKKEYYKNIAESPISTIGKILDRCHNVSTMAGVFTKEKIKEYIWETETFVLPLIRTCKDNYPEYQSVLFVLKYHITSILEAIRGAVLTFSGEDLSYNG